MIELCAVAGCPNEADLFHPERYVAFCRDHRSEILPYGIVGSEQVDYEVVEGDTDD